MRTILSTTIISIILTSHAQAGEPPPLPPGEQLARSERFQGAVAEALGDERARAIALENPTHYLRLHGVAVPETVSVDFLPDLRFQPIDYPTDDWNPYVFTQFNCRQYWVPARDDSGKLTGGYELQTVCLGFRVTSNRVPGGPIGHRR
jgi:hypothetical protein